FVVGEQQQGTEVRGPPDSVLLHVVEDVADGHVVGGEEEFVLAGFPDCDGPIADDATEAVGFPAIERGSYDGNVSGAGFEVAAEICNQWLAIVEATIPGKDETAVREMRLSLLTRFGCGVEGAIEKGDRT